MNGKIALVTGGSRGIGRAIALQLAKDGCDVAVLYAGRREAADQTVSLLEAAGARALAIQCDVSDGEAAAAAVGEVEKTLGPIAILVNNAGIIRDGLTMRMSSEDFRAVIDVNLTGAFHMIRACLPGFVRRRAGRIVNITSVSGMMGNPGQANYASSKAGAHRPDQDRRPRSRLARRYGQRRGPGLHRNGHDRRHERSRPAKGPFRRTHGPHRQAGGRGKRRFLPGKRRRRLCHRLRPQGGRRHVYLTLSHTEGARRRLL